MAHSRESRVLEEVGNRLIQALGGDLEAEEVPVESLAHRGFLDELEVLGGAVGEQLTNVFTALFENGQSGGAGGGGSWSGTRDWIDIDKG